MIIVTGGAGFIGHALIKNLNQEGHKDIVIVDRLRDSDKWANLNGVDFLEYIHADEFYNPKLHKFHPCVKKASFIFHLGACSTTTERDMDYLWQNNVMYSRAIFELAAEKSIPLIYASSAATYGAGERGYGDRHEDVDQLRPLNRYGLSKQLFDQWVLRQKKRPPFWIGLKFFNVFGPGEAHKGDMRSLVYKSFFQIQETKKVKLFKSYKKDFADGGQLRDFVYVKDVCRAMVDWMKKVPKNKGQYKASGLYNMGTGEARSFYDLACASFKAMGEKVNIEYIEMPEMMRPQYQYFTQADMSKFKKIFPKFQFTGLDEAVHDYIHNHLM